MKLKGLVAGAAAGVALFCLGAPQAQALEFFDGASPAKVDDGMITKAYIARRGGGVYHGGVYHGPRGGTYYHGGAPTAAESTGGAPIAAGPIATAIGPDMAAGRVPAGTPGRPAAPLRRARRSASSARPRRPPTPVLPCPRPLLVLHQSGPDAGFLGRLPIAPDAQEGNVTKKPESAGPPASSVSTWCCGVQIAWRERLGDQ